MSFTSSHPPEFHLAQALAAQPENSLLNRWEQMDLCRSQQYMSDLQ
jgi:hypothetical protein